MITTCITPYFPSGFVNPSRVNKRYLINVILIPELWLRDNGLIQLLTYNSPLLTNVSLDKRN